mgnify:CR=1 FL=1
MMDWTDRHCRYFHRQISQRALLYTEMIVSAAIRHGQRERLLGFNPSEYPLALQLGGSDPAELALAARVGEQYGYDEVNLNCGCPSDRVQSGAFGACLMNEPALVADCVRAMRDKVSVPVTVKHRIGLGRNEDYGFVRDFVGTVAAAGCSVFIVHARNAWLEGLSPKENRTVPPLRYQVVHQLAADFPGLSFWLNGGLVDHQSIDANIGQLPGVMVGRAAYDNPWILSEVDARYGFAAHIAPDQAMQAGLDHSIASAAPGSQSGPDRAAVIAAMTAYARQQVAQDVPLRRITRHMLGLFNGLPGARAWRRTLSDASALQHNDPDLIARAYEQLARRSADAAADEAGDQTAQAV